MRSITSECWWANSVLPLRKTTWIIGPPGLANPKEHDNHTKARSLMVMPGRGFYICVSSRCPRRPRGRSARHPSLSLAKEMLILLLFSCTLLMIQKDSAHAWTGPGLGSAWHTQIMAGLKRRINYLHYNNSVHSIFPLRALFIRWSTDSPLSAATFNNRSSGLRPSCRCLTIKKGMKFILKGVFECATAAESEQLQECMKLGTGRIRWKRSFLPN